MTDPAKKAELVAINDANEEKPWQSGVGVFGAGGVLWALGVILTQVGTHGTDFLAYDHMTTITALGALFGFAGVLYRRFMPGLKPMFTKG